MKRVTQFLMGLVIIAIIGSTGCGAATSAQGKAASSKPVETMTLRCLGTPGSMSIQRLATELGYAQEEGIEFKNVGMWTGGPAEIQALGAGSIDLVAATNPVPVINAIKAGFKIRIVLAGSTTRGFDEQGQLVSGSTLVVPEDSVIKSPKDLVGKRIGANTVGGTADYTIRKWLRGANVSRDQVDLVAIPTANQVQVFQQRQVDMLYAYRESLDMIKKTDRVREFPVADIVGDVLQGAVAVSEDMITKNPDTVRRLARAYVKAWDWVRENSSEYRKMALKVVTEEGGNPDLNKYLLVSGRAHALVNDEDIQFWINELVFDGKLKEGEAKPFDIYTNEFNPYYKQ